MLDEATKLIIQDVAERTAKETVKETLTSLGVDTSDPIKSQKVFATMRALASDGDFEKDLTHLRRWRVAMDAVQSKGLMAAMGLLAIGAVTFIFSGLKIKLGG